MKTFAIRSLWCLVILLGGQLQINAQKFSFRNNMFSRWESATLGDENKKDTGTFKLNNAPYNHQWTLTTDGKCAGQNGDTKCIHVGPGETFSQRLILESSPSFSHVDIVRVSSAMAKSRKYSQSVMLINGTDTLHSTLVKKVVDERITTCIFEFDNKKDIVDKSALKFEMAGEKYEKGAMYLYYLEVASKLSDAVALSKQHVKPKAVFSYQVQRTFASNHWNTICLPFNVSKEALTETMGKSCALREFNKKVENNVLKFKNAVANFENDTVIHAGVPYLIKPAAKVENPIFSNVVYKDVKPQTVQDETGRYAFVGTFDPVKLSVDGSNLFLLANGNLAKPRSKELSEMYGMRAYFKVSEQTSSSAKQITYAIDCGSETVTGIQSQHSHTSTHSQHIYNLQGVDVGSDIHHLPAGVYVTGGKKIIKR